MENEKTYGIQEVADRFSVSYQAVAQRIQILGCRVIDKNGKKKLPEESYNQLVDYFKAREKVKNQIKEKKANSSKVEVIVSNKEEEEKEQKTESKSTELDIMSKLKLIDLNSNNKVLESENEYAKDRIKRLQEDLNEAKNELQMWKNMYAAKDNALNTIAVKNIEILKALPPKKKKGFFRKDK